MLCVSLSANAIDVDLEKGEPGLNPFPGDRSENSVVTASLDDQVLTITLNELNSSQIIITNLANQTVFNQSFAPSFSVQANLSSLPAGNYTLYVYAFGTYWYGSFGL